MNLTLEENGITYELVIHSYYEGRSASLSEPQESEEIEYSIVNIKSACSEHVFFSIDDLFMGEPEMHDAVLKAYHAENYDNACIIGDQIHEEMNDLRD